MPYTKGPWNLDSEDWIEASHPDKDGQKIAVIEYAGCGTHEAYFPNEADKALVVSAPELYEALKELIKCNDTAGSDPAVSQWIGSPVRKQCVDLLAKLKEIEE